MSAPIVHGMSRTPTYKSWDMMRYRCRSRRATQYAQYGGRGIKVCDAWRDSFEAFLADMGERPSIDHCLSRIDHDKDYEPGNVVWGLKTPNRNDGGHRGRFTRWGTPVPQEDL